MRVTAIAESAVEFPTCWNTLNFLLRQWGMRARERACVCLPVGRHDWAERGRANFVGARMLTRVYTENARF